MNELIESIVIDNKNYAIINETNYNNNKYVLLSNINNRKDICIRKIIIEDNVEYIVGLDSKEEFDNVINAFTKNINI